MAGKKVSELDSAGALNENDILYIIRNSVEGGMESKKASLGDLLSMLGSVSSKGLERVQLGNKTQAEFYDMLNAQLIAEKPERPTCTMMMVLESLENGAQGSMGSITVFPTSEGKYVMGSGPNALGNGELGIALFFIPNDLADGVSMLCWFAPMGMSGGTAGKDGNSVTLKGSFDNFSDLPTAGSNQIGDCWFVKSTLYSWDGGNWINLGDFGGPQGTEGPMGPAGPEGPMGPMLEFVGVFNTAEELPINVNVNSIATVGTFFYFFNGGEWISLGNFAGPQGAQGEKGDPGTPNFAIKSGNFSSNYSNNLAAANAHGTIGGKEYWKYTINLDKATYNKYPVCNVLLQEIPCNDAGVPVPYTLHHFFNSSGLNQPPNIVLMLILHEPATQLLSNSTGQYGPLGLVDNVQYEPHYSVSYWY